MNAKERASLIAELEGDIGNWGLSQSLESILQAKGYDLDKLDRYTLAAIDERFFTCDTCNHSMPVDELEETEAGDGFLCKECACND